jgi:hypothetical protein
MVVPLPLISPVELWKRNYLLLTVALLVTLMEEELPSFNSNTTGDINGRETTIVLQ